MILHYYMYTFAFNFLGTDDLRNRSKHELTSPDRTWINAIIALQLLAARWCSVVSFMPLLNDLTISNTNGGAS